MVAWSTRWNKKNQAEAENEKKQQNENYNINDEMQKKMKTH